MALNDVIARLSVQLGLETAAFEKNANSASRRTKKLGDDAEALGFRIGRMGKAFITATAALAGGAALATLTGLVKQGLDYASALGEQAEQLGVTTKALQEYRYAASQAGISQEEMDQALSKLTRTMGEAVQGAKAPAEAFQRLGIDIKAFVASGKDAGDLIPLIAQGLQGIASPAERAAIQVDLFGRAGQKLSPLLNQGAAGVNGLRDAAQNLGIVLSDKLINQADEAADKMAALQNVLKIQVAAFVAANAQSISALADELLDLAAGAIKALNAWLEFRKVMNTRNAQYARADQYIAGRKDLSPGEKGFARERAREIIDQRLGIQSESAGPFGLRRSTIAQPTNIAGRKDLSPGEKGFARERSREIIDQRRSTIAQPTNIAIASALPLPPAVIEAMERMPGTIENIGRAWEKLSKGAYIEDIAADMAILNEQTENVKATSKDAAATLKYSFEEAADGVIGALDRMSSAFSGGGFLDKLSAVLNFGLQLGSIGVFGKKVQTSINLPRHANGTSFAPGGLSLVGERGPELVDMRRGSRVTPAHRMSGMSRVQVIPSPYFDVVVDGRIQRSAPAVASLGAAEAQTRMARGASRRVG